MSGDRRSVPLEQVLQDVANPRYEWNASSIDWIDRILRQRAYRIVVQPAMLCPCVGPVRDGGRGVPDANCPACAGIGRTWAAADEYEGRAFVWGLERDRRVEQPQGEWEHGWLHATFVAGTRLDYYDRVKMPDAAQVVSEVRVRPATGSSVVPLRYDAQEIVAVSVRNPDTRAVERLTAVTDYELDADNKRVTIKDTAATHAGEALHVSVRYLAYPWFYVQQIPNQSRGTFVQIGQIEEKWAELPVYARMRRGDFLSDAVP